MIGVIIALSIFCIVLLLLLGKQDDKNTALAAENVLLKGRMENMREAATKVSTVTHVIGNFACTFFGKGKWTFFRKVKCTS